MAARANLSPRVRATFFGAGPGLAGALAAIPAVREFARSRTTAAELVVLPDGMRAVRKSWTWPTWRDRVRGAFRTTFSAPSPAEREWDGLARLRELPSGPFAPEPLAWADVRRAGVLTSCVLLLEEIAESVDLATFLLRERDVSRRAAVLADLALRTREMHQAGLLDREHHARNVLVAGVRTWKVDCWKQRAYGRALTSAETLADVAALDVALVRLASAAERDAFLAGVCGGSPPREFLTGLGTERSRIEPREARRLPS